MPFKHNLGAVAIDKVSNFIGKITARAEYLHSENRRYEVSPGLDANGKPIEPQWFDEGRLDTGVQAVAQG